MTRILFASIIYFTFIFSTLAFENDPITYEGEVELRGGIVKVGKINIDFETDIVRFYNDNGTIDTYSPFNIVSLYFYDVIINKPRTFVTLQHSPKKNTTAGFYLYELLKVGKMDILRKAIKSIDIEKLTQYSFGKRIKMYDRGFEYYVFFNGNLIPLSDFNTSILPLIKAQTDERLERFIVNRDVDLKDKLQPLIVVEYFNALNEKPLAKASLD